MDTMDTKPSTPWDAKAKVVSMLFFHGYIMDTFWIAWIHFKMEVPQSEQMSFVIHNQRTSFYLYFRHKAPTLGPCV